MAPEAMSDDVARVSSVATMTVATNVTVTMVAMIDEDSG